MGMAGVGKSALITKDLATVLREKWVLRICHDFEGGFSHRPVRFRKSRLRLC